jgi:hypothetical protein
MVVNAWPDGEHYMVEFDDGDRDSRVPRAHLRPQCVFPAPADVAAATRLEAFSRGVVARRATRAAAAQQRAAVQVQAPAVREASRRRPEQQAAEVLQAAARQQAAYDVAAEPKANQVRTAAATTLQAWARQQAALRVAAGAKTRAAVRAYFNGELPLPRRPLGNGSHLGFLLGATVEARYKGRHGWFPAAIAAVRTAGDAFATFELRYADGDVEAGVPRRRVRLHGQGEPFHLSHGTACEARFGNSKQLYPAMVVNAWPDGEHYMVEFDDGDRDSRVPRDHIFVACSFPLRTHARAATTLQVRSRVGSAVRGVSNFSQTSGWGVSRVGDALEVLPSKSTTTTNRTPLSLWCAHVWVNC